MPYQQTFADQRQDAEIPEMKMKILEVIANTVNGTQPCAVLILSVCFNKYTCKRIECYINVFLRTKLSYLTTG